MRQRLALVAVACVGSVLMAGCGDDETQPAGASRSTTVAVASDEDVTIDIAEFKFVPRSVRIAAGTSVTWSNSDKAVHSAENGGEKGPAQFDTGRLDKDGRKSIRFDKTGVYTYYCVYHRFMEATVTVAK